MNPVSVYTEWDPLEEVIVGRAANARIARPDPGLFAVEYRTYGSADRIPSGRYPDRVIGETEEDLEALVETFRSLGITVRRPDVWDHGRPFGSPDWETDGQYNYCPRDLFVAVGGLVIGMEKENGIGITSENARAILPRTTHLSLGGQRDAHRGPIRSDPPVAPGRPDHP